MIHFFCGHSLHASYLDPSSMITLQASESVGALRLGGAAGMWIEECPRFATEQDVTVSITQGIGEYNLKNDELFIQLTTSRHGFVTAVEYL